MSTFGERLRKSRKAVKMTQAAVAKRAGMPQSLLSELENDEYPTSGYTPRLAHIYKVTARWLADGVGPREVSDAEALEDPQVLDLWTKYSQADDATRAAINYLLSGTREKWMSQTLADTLVAVRHLVLEQFESSKK